MKTLINQILNHPNLLHPSTTITAQMLKNNYLKNHLISINCINNLTSLLKKLNKI
jgi:hypothetical protein